MTPAIALVCAASLLAAICDVRTRRIPNAIAIGLFVCGIGVAAFAGWQAPLVAIAIALAVLFAGSIAFSFKLIGGGDVKLLAAAAATLGLPDGLNFILFTVLCGGLIALAYSAARGRLSATFANMQSIALPVFAGVRPARLENGTAMPYALAIFAGAVCTAIVNGFAPHLRLLQ